MSSEISFTNTVAKEARKLSTGGLLQHPQKFSFEEKSFCKGNSLGNVQAEFDAPKELAENDLLVPEKLLMGPGPSNPSPRVLQACSLPTIGHLHPDFYKLLDEVKVGLKYLFQTSNEWTIAVSGPGHLGMESILVNLLEAGDKIAVGVNGLWGMRAAETARRIGAEVIEISKKLGQIVTKEDVVKVLENERPKLLFLVHSESSTGIMQPLNGIGEMCRRYDCLLCVDTVASLGGVPFFVDKWKIDAAYTGSQKVLGCPPGLAPVTFGPRAVEKIKTRKTPVKSFLLDMNLLSNYWNCGEKNQPRVYHHTPPVNLIYALRESLAEIAAETLPVMWARHADCSERLLQGVKALGFKPFVQTDDDRLPTVATLLLPEGINPKELCQHVIENHGIEVAGGLGPTAGKIIRIGTMGYNAYFYKVDKVILALKEFLEETYFNGRL